MLKAGKTGVAIVMGLLLSLTLLAAGALAEDTATAQNTTSVGNRAVIFTGDFQQGAQQLLPVSSVQQTKAGQANTLLGRHPRHARHVAHFRNNKHAKRVTHFRRNKNAKRVTHFRRNKNLKRVTHFRQKSVRCAWVRRGWGKWRKLVKVCRK